MVRTAILSFVKFEELSGESKISDEMANPLIKFCLPTISKTL